MRRFGAIPYITPLHSATESSSTPKSVIKTTVGGGDTDGCCATRLPAKNNVIPTHNSFAHIVAADFLAGLLIRMNRSSPKRIFSLLGLRKRKNGNCAAPS